MVSSSGCAPGEGVPSLPGDAEKGASGSRSEATGLGQRFPRAFRLTTRRQFLAVYREGRRVGSRSFTLFGLPNETGRYRLGITVTRKVGCAVRRNRIKRILREIFRKNLRDHRTGLDIVVNAHRGLDTTDSKKLESEFRSGIGRLVRRFES